MPKSVDDLIRKRASALRYRYGKCRDSAHKQIGLRRLREALQLSVNNPTRAAECLSLAEATLPYAEAVNERGTRYRRSDG